MGVEETTEKAAGTAKEVAGKLLGDDELAREGMEQQEKAAAAQEAEELEQRATEKRREAARTEVEQED